MTKFIKTIENEYININNIQMLKVVKLNNHFCIRAKLEGSYYIINKYRNKKRAVNQLSNLINSFN